MTDSPVAPLSKEDFSDLYVANSPLAVRGLLPHNDYAAYEHGSDVPGTLAVLQIQAQSLFAIQSMVRVANSRRNPLLTLVRAMGETPLHLFYEAEKLMEAYVNDSEWPLIRLSQRVFPHLITLIGSKGEQTMKKLGLVLEQLAEIAWEGGLRGRSLKKNSLMAPLDEVFAKLGHQSESADLNALRAATIEDIFEHLERIAEQQYRPGQRKWDATRNFVDTFYTEVFANVYGGKLHKLLADEKLIRSAYMFYVREQIPRKSDQVSDGN
jgi:CRISPR-associated protein Csc3